MANADVIRKIIRDTTSANEGYDLATQTNQVRLNELNKQITALKEGICDIADTNLSTYLTTSLYPDSLMIKGDTYNQAYILLGDLTNWRLLDIQLDNDSTSSLHFVVMSDSMFYVVDNHVSIFEKHPGMYDIAAGRRDSTGDITDIRYSNILDSTFDSTAGITFVEIDTPILSIDNDVLYLYRTSYNEISDSTVSEIVIEWDSAHDYLIHPLGLDGTYGLVPMRDNISLGNGVITSNKDKNSEIQTTFEKYAAKHE